MAAVTTCSDFGAQEIKVSHCSHCFPIYLPWSDGTGCHDLSFFWMLSFTPALSLSSFAFIKMFFSSSSLSAIRVVSFAYEVIDISPSNLDSGLCFIQPSISHDVLCIYIKLSGWQIITLMYSFPNLEPVHSSMSSSKCCLLPSIQASQEVGNVVWYSHFFKNFPQFVVICTVKGFLLSPNQWATREFQVLHFILKNQSHAELIRSSTIRIN